MMISCASNGRRRPYRETFVSYNDEHSGLFWICRRRIAERDTTRRVSRNGLILKDFSRLTIELARKIVDASHFIAQGRFGRFSNAARALFANIAREGGKPLSEAWIRPRSQRSSGSSGEVRPARRSSTASAASRSSASDGGREKSSSQRRSDSISASSHAPIASCSSSESLCASSIARSRTLPMHESLSRSPVTERPWGCLDLIFARAGGALGSLVSPWG